VLSAFVSQNVLAPAYPRAIVAGYLGHEFGDVSFIV
jgi:S-adenosylmethionine:tRNA-ribosyltransferase-isomerase (queuine synthetase)